MSFATVKTLFYLGLGFLIAACVSYPPPIMEFNYAKVAIHAAHAVEATKYDPAHLNEAEEAYRAGKKYFNEREYEKARVAFFKARNAAEKAENTTRAMRKQTGELF